MKDPERGSAAGSATRLGASWVVGMAAGWGCGPTIHPTFDSPEPAARNSAIVRAAASGDTSAQPDLVRMLESDDPATRLLAITALERQTGKTLGYDYGASPFRREQAVERWREWLAANGPAKEAGR